MFYLRIRTCISSHVFVHKYIHINRGIVDAGEVRVAHFCGKGRPDRAKSFAKKTIFVGLLISIVLSSIFLALGDRIPKWLTSDLAIQKMIQENIPLIGFGNIIMTGGNTCWAVLGAQGRYRLATFYLFCIVVAGNHSLGCRFCLWFVFRSQRNYSYGDYRLQLRLYHPWLLSVDVGLAKYMRESANITS